VAEGNAGVCRARFASTIKRQFRSDGRRKIAGRFRRRDIRLKPRHTFVPIRELVTSFGGPHLPLPE